MPAKKSLAAADEIIGLVYQGPLEAQPWQSFLRCLRTRLNSDYAGIMLRSGGKDLAPLVIMDHASLLDPQEIERRSALGAKYSHLDPLVNTLASSKSGTIYTIDEVIPRATLIKGDYYQHVMKPNQMEYFLGMTVTEPGGWQSFVGLMNTKRRGNFGAPEKKFFEAFRPHMERALEIYARLKQNESEKHILEETFNRLMIGTFILDGRGRIIDVNGAGQELLRLHKSIHSTKGKLGFTKKQDNERLQGLIEHALSARKQPSSAAFVDAIQVKCPPATQLGVLVRSVHAQDAYWNEVSPSVAVYVGEVGHQSIALEHFVSRMFGLTRSEAMLATLLAQGMTLAEAAAKLQITHSTVRSYTKNLFGKVGVSRQAELVRLILTSVAILA